MEAARNRNYEKALEKAVEGVSMNRRAIKKNRTLSLEVDNFDKLQEYCLKEKTSASQVIDDLIAGFISRVNRAKRSN